MAASNLVNCLLIILLVNIAAEVLHKPNLRDDSDDDDELNNEHDPGKPPPSDLLTRQNLNGIQTTLKRYKCHSCEPPDCSTLTTCTNAVQCWKSRVRESTGEESVTRGCITNSEKLPLICRFPSVSVPNKRNASGQFQIDCCSGDFCNDGDFLPSVFK